MLNDADRKLLTEMIGECWHIVTQEGSVCHCSCGKSFGLYSVEAVDHMNLRTFTTWDDLGAVKQAIERADKLDDFILWSYRKFSQEVKRARMVIRGQMVSEIDNPIEFQFPIHLINPDRFCQLVAEWGETEKWW